jgi:hypothetical protein
VLLEPLPLGLDTEEPLGPSELGPASDGLPAR